MRFHQFLAVGCLSFFSLASHAEILTGLYQVREPVSSQTPEERTQATQKALETLVLRLTGDAKAVQSPALEAIRKDPQQIISQYGYDAGPPESLQVDFDPVSTDRALRQAGLSLWGTNRPALLGWWLNDSVDGSSLVGDGQSAAEPLRLAAQHRGLPLRLPLADLSEQLVGTAENLEGSNPAPLKDASERYGADALLAVHAHEDEGKWTAKWRLWVGEQQEQGSAEAPDQAALADAVMLAVSQRLAPRYAVKPGISTEQLLEVQGMTLERYAQLTRLLEPFGGQLKSVDGDRIVYQVNGSADQLRSQLGLAQLHEVAADQAPGATAASGAQLHFRW
ncbi:DUF2066 domain-containing protein [Pseudomonas versuta]|uniref:DUF2066 domain-containing protein n=1 Tax=Pseudomonas versuta TaxID=1788301 RepID=A0A0M3UDC4_9PSED|nr:DUF2066 domain-containing protein [Pseudomonas versuta]ALE87189.1 hypothetical protein AOC04_02625 [Pseudomonas versuta]OKA24425.1 hypothetical protein BOH73_00625 [Pseudomonas versuta]OKA28271.1 hypothetical protein BOH74_02145 [Pseudomonas versuta]